MAPKPAITDPFERAFVESMNEIILNVSEGGPSAYHRLCKIERAIASFDSNLTLAEIQDCNAWSEVYSYLGRKGQYEHDPDKLEALIAHVRKSVQQT